MSEKIKTIYKKPEQNKAQYNLDRQTSKISALSSENVSKYEFLTGKDVLAENTSLLMKLLNVLYILLNVLYIQNKMI